MKTRIAVVRRQMFFARLSILSWWLCVCCVITGSATAAVPVFEALVSLGETEGSPHGVIRDAAGNLYGVTGGGGTFHQGSIYKVDDAGGYTLLHSFDRGSVGPGLALTRNPVDGSLYGSDAHSVYKLDAAGLFSVIYNRPGSANDMSPVTLASDGNLYGILVGGGSSQLGSIFRLDTNGNFAEVHSFNGSNGTDPSLFSQLIAADDGALYGVTRAGGEFGLGTVFRISPGSGSAVDVSVVHSFDGLDGLVSPMSVAMRPGGGVVGVAEDLGLDGTARTAVYKLEPNGNYSVLEHFPENIDGNLVVASDGSVYGSIFPAGTNPGSVFKLDPTGNRSIAHSLGLRTGDGLQGSLALAEDGSLYGTTTQGKLALFRLSAAGNFEALHYFGVPLGARPLARSTLASDGNLYGVHAAGGTFNNGVIYRLNDAGSYQVLHHFDGFAGASPEASLARDTLSNTLYGVTSRGGNFGAGTSDQQGWGTIFQFDPNDGTVSTLYKFDGITGAVPGHALLATADGLYGTTSQGGDFNRGTAFFVNRNGGHTVLHSFGEPDADGKRLTPTSALIRWTDGSLVGAAKLATFNFTYAGVLYKIDSAGNFAIIQSFPDVAIVGDPILDPDNNLLVVTEITRENGVSAIRKIDPAGNVTVLHDLSTVGSLADGLTRGADGSLYFVTSFPRELLIYGTVYRLDPANTLSVVHEFIEAEGGNPEAGVIFGADGALYGTTPRGGQFGGGTVYRIRFVDGQAPTITIEGAQDQLIEATGPSGASATFNPTASTENGETVPVSCVPNSGVHVPLGETVITCRATFNGASATARFKISVRDTTPPALSLPGPIASTSSTVSYQATATDLVSETVAVSCTPASGSKFPVGQTTVACAATDGAGNTSNGTFTVTVTAPPTGDNPVANDDTYGKTGRRIIANGNREQSIEFSRRNGVLANDLPKTADGRKVRLVSGPKQSTGTGVGTARPKLVLKADGAFELELIAPGSANTAEQRRVSKRGSYEFQYTLTYKGVTTAPAKVIVVVE